MMAKVDIGSKWEAPTIDRPYMRQLPRHWDLEGAHPAPKVPWWHRTDRIVAILVALLVLVACAQAAIRVFTE